MTSTPFNVGLTDNTRSSSRVLRPPGGGHTDIFGGEPEPPRGRRAGPPQPASQIGQGDQPKATNGTAPSQNGNEAPVPVQVQETIKEAPEPAPESPRVEKAETPREEAKTEPAKIEPVKIEPAKIEPPKRVRVPPGGFSSGLW